MRYVLIISLLLHTLFIDAQVTQGEDVKVGLVLSGGGAKGLAHIGVLKVIEEAGVRIDYIAGTSMGAVVGGLYAAGYTATELDSIFKAVNFDNIIQDNLPRSAKTFYERDDDERYVISLPFDNFKLKLPTSLSKGQNTYNLLAQNLDHVSGVDDFSKLQIPFFCIATDVEKGEQVILDNGYLPEAITASGALPSLFSPVLLKGKLLIDGGVINNYPIDELRAKNMDIIIGVDVQDTLRGRANLKTAPEVLIQINNYRSSKAMIEKKADTDIYIRPAIDEYSVVSFDDGSSIVAAGRSETLKQFDRLKEIASRQRPLSRKRIKPQPNDSLNIAAVTITGNKNYTRSYVLGKLKLTPPVNVAYQDFANGINNLTATENFDKIGHRLQKTEEGNILHLELQESSSTQSVRLALHYDDLYRTAGLINLTKKRLFFKNDIASLDVILGDNLRYNLDYYIDKGFYWSVGIKSTYTSFDQGINARLLEDLQDIELPGLNRVTLDYQDLTNKIYLQTLFVKQFSLDLGIQHKFLDIETETLTPTSEGETGIIFERSHMGGVYAQLKYDTLDNKYFPNNGVFFDSDFDLFLFSSDFNNTFTEFGIANAQLKYVTSFGKAFSLTTEFGAGLKVGGTANKSLDFFLGGYGAKKINNLVPFLGYDYLSISGDGYVKGLLDLDFEFYPKNHLNITANFANVADDLFESPGNWLPPPAYSGYSLGYGAETLLGPINIKYSYSPELNRSDWFVSLGFQF